PFAGEGGFEYLFGQVFNDEGGKLQYRGDWALTREDERRAFEAFVDFIMVRWKQFPDLHIYHYAPYEPAALKRLMGRMRRARKRSTVCCARSSSSTFFRSFGMASARASKVTPSRNWSH